MISAIGSLGPKLCGVLARYRFERRAAVISGNSLLVASAFGSGWVKDGLLLPSLKENCPTHFLYNFGDALSCPACAFFQSIDPIPPPFESFPCQGFNPVAEVGRPLAVPCRLPAPCSSPPPFPLLILAVSSESRSE